MPKNRPYVPDWTDGRSGETTLQVVREKMEMPRVILIALFLLAIVAVIKETSSAADFAEMIRAGNQSNIWAMGLASAALFGVCLALLALSFGSRLKPFAAFLVTSIFLGVSILVRVFGYFVEIYARMNVAQRMVRYEGPNVLTGMSLLWLLGELAALWLTIRGIALARRVTRLESILKTSTSTTNCAEK